MKYVWLLFVLLPQWLVAQTQVDYEMAMAKFMTYYNHLDGEQIRGMWPPEMGKAMANRWTPAMLQEMHRQFGKLRSYQYLGIDKDDPDKVVVFRTIYSKVGEKTTSLTLDRRHYLGDFRPVTSSPGIDKMLRYRK